MIKFKISKPGKNVLTETNSDNLIISSDLSTLKYYLTGSISLVVNLSAEDRDLYYITTSIDHSLGYLPYFVVYCKDDLMSGWEPVGKFEAGSGAYRQFGAVATNTGIIFYADGYKGLEGTANYTINFHYKIFRNRLF